MGFISNLFFKKEKREQVKVVDNVRSYRPDVGISTRVDLTRAELNSTVFTSINIIVNTLSKCPVEIYRIDNTGKKVKHTTHKWYNSVHFNPENTLTTKKWLANALTSMYLQGNAFYLKDFVTKKLVELPVLEKVSPLIDGQYYYKFDSMSTWIPADQIIHFYLLSKDGGRTGLNPIQSIASELAI